MRVRYVGRFGLWSGTARSRPDPSVSPDVVKEGLESSGFILGDLVLFHVACFVVAIVEAVSSDEAAGTHLCI